jgi:hypothetical protein
MIDMERTVKLFGNTFEDFLSERTEIKGYANNIYYSNLSEAEKFTVSEKLIAALYKSSMEKYAIIDFGKIPDSKGDVDRLDHISDIQETVDTIGELAPDMPELKTINDTLLTLRSFKKEFSLGFIQDAPLIVMIYNTTVLSLFTALSLSMNICLDYIRTPNGSIDTSSKIMYKSNSQYNVVIDNLNKLNQAAQKGDLKKVFDSCLKKESFIGASLGAGLGYGVGASVGTGLIVGVALVASAILIVPVTRELIYFHYNMRMNISEFFKHQAEFLDMNISELRSANSSKNAAVIKKQEQRMRTLQNLANKFEVDFSKANEKTRVDLQKKVDTDMIKSSLNSDKNDISSFSLL